MGTLLTLDDPAVALQQELAARGLEVSNDQARRAIGAEITVYKAHHLEGADDVSVRVLRQRCADALRAELPVSLAPGDALDVLLGMLRFSLLPGTEHALDRLGGAGIAVAAVSNWDASLAGTLHELGLAGRFGAVVTSAQVGVAKPDPAPLRRALELLGDAPVDGAVMVGDEEVDVLAAAALGIPCARVAPGAGIAAVVDELLALPA